MLLAWRDVL